MLGFHNRRLAKALVSFDLGTNNEEKIQYLSSLVVPLEVRCFLNSNFLFTLFINFTKTHTQEALRSVLQNPNFPKNSQNPEIISTLVKYIEVRSRLKGNCEI
jgi:hypothetical protein